MDRKSDAHRASAIAQRRIGALCATAIVALASPAHGNGWVNERGHCYAKVWDRAIIGSKAYTALALRDTQAVATYHDQQLNLYGECGVHPRITAVLSMIPAAYAKSGDRSTFYMGPFIAGARFGILTQGRLKLAATAKYGYAPAVGDKVLSTSTITTSDGRAATAFYQPAVENHSGELELGAGVGFNLGDHPSYLAGGLGVRLNSAAGVDHVLLAELKFGVTFFKHLALGLSLGLHEPFFREVALTNTSGVGQTRYLGFGLSASYWFIDALAVCLELGGVAYAESNAATPSISLGLESRFALF